MKKMMAMMLLATTVFTSVAEMARSEWQGKVGACAQNPALLQQTIGQLSAADQLAFLGQVNQAISAMPGSKDQKAAAFYAANKAAVVGATRENRTAVLAEVFATVPVEVLTIINERFAEELLNRKDSPSVTDNRFIEISTNVMAAVDQRVSSVENGGARAAFAAMMLVRASGGSPEGLANTLADMISDSTASQEAKSTWLPAALSGDTPSYDQILGSTQSGEEPNKNNITPSTTGATPVLTDLSSDTKKDDSSGTGTPTSAPTAAPATAPAATPTTAPTAETASTGSDDAGGKTGDDFQGGIFDPNGDTVPGAVNPSASTGNPAMDPSGISGTGSNGEGVPVPTPRETILSPTIVDPVTGEVVPNPYYNKKHGDGTPKEPEPTPTPPIPPYLGQGI